MQYTKNSVPTQAAEMPDEFVGSDGLFYWQYPQNQKVFFQYLSQEDSRSDKYKKHLGPRPDDAPPRKMIPWKFALKQLPITEPEPETEPPKPKKPITLESFTVEDERMGKRSSEEQPEQTEGETEPADEQKKIDTIRTDEVALEFWSFRRNPRTNEWVLDGIYQTGLLNYFESQRYAKRFRPDGTTTFLIHGDTVIEPIIDTVVRDCAKAYINSNPGTLNVENLSATFEGRMEIFNRQQHLIINKEKLKSLATHTRPLLRDTPTTAYIPYRNGIVEVTKDGATLRPYQILDDRCIWKNQVLNRDFNPDADASESHIARFHSNVTNGENDRLQAFRTATGYCIHHYGNPAEGQAILLYDEEITDARKPEGGTGKGVFTNAIRQLRPVAVIDGKKFDPNDRFCFQQVEEDTAVVWIDDPVVSHPKAERRFSLERFFSLLTEGWSVEKKHEHAFIIPPKQGPKLLISSNVVMANEGSSNVRRQFILEFSNHYKKQIRKGNEKPIQAEHGCIFFSDDWDAREWERFDKYMVDCVQTYLSNGLQPYALRSADQNRLRQTAGEEFYEWVTTCEGTGLLPNREYHRDTLWTRYKIFAGLPEQDRLTRSFTNNIQQYAKTQGWKYERGRDTRQISFTLTPI